jgi:integrase
MAGESSSALAARPRTLARLVHADLPKYFTRDEIARLTSAARPGRDRLILRTLWETGVRVSELLSLTPSSIDFAAETLSVATLKRRTHHLRAIPIRPALLGELARHNPSLSPSGRGRSTSNAHRPPPQL